MESNHLPEGQSLVRYRYATPPSKIRALQNADLTISRLIVDWRSQIFDRLWIGASDEVLQRALDGPRIH